MKIIPNFKFEFLTSSCFFQTCFLNSNTTLKIKAGTLTIKRVNKIKDNILSSESEKGETMRNIFLFGRPGMYFFFVEIVIMPISFYLALWITNFATVATHLSYSDMIGWQFKTLLPGLACSCLYFYIVKCMALLEAVTNLDSDAVEEILDQTESSKSLSREMREKMLTQLLDMGDPETEMKALFDKIDDNHSELLSRSEFQIFLNSLGITFSRKKWTQIFTEIDRSHDNEISLTELFLFLFPDHDRAKTEEKNRLISIGERVKKKATLHSNSGHRRLSLFQLSSQTVQSSRVFASNLKVESVEDFEEISEKVAAAAPPLKPQVSPQKSPQASSHHNHSPLLNRNHRSEADDLWASSLLDSIEDL